MFVKTATIILTIFVVTAQGERLWNNLLGKWANVSQPGWYAMPQNLSTAESEGWTEIEGACTSDDVIGMGYYSDPRVTLLYDLCTGHVTGLLFGIPVSDVENVPFDYTSVPHITVKTLNGAKYYSSIAYFDEDEEAGTRQIQSLRSDGTLENIPTNTAELVSTTAYEQKVCITTMGHHYYKMNRSTTLADWSPWAVTSVDEKNIISIVYVSVGVMSIANNRNWTENFSRTSLAYYIPTTPQWLMDLLESFGFISFHLFFHDPRSFNCTDSY